MNNSQARHAAVLQEAADLFAMKNASYQDSWRDQGWRGNVSRILEKAKRIRALLWRQSVLLNGSKEHPRETLLDVINTAVFAIINMDDGVEWGEGIDNKPLKPPQAFMYSNGDPVEPEVLRERVDHSLPFSYTTSGGQHEEHTLVAPSVGEQTMVNVTVGELPTPGEEEQPQQPPSPRKRERGQGSGPRRVADRPQA